MNVRVAPGLLEEIIAHAKACYPREGCGLLAGKQNTAERFIPMENTLSSETEYEMDPQRLLQELRSLRDSGEELVAIYHSHPFGTPRPSKRDVQFAYYPEAACIIVSLAEPERAKVGVFRIIEGEVLEVEVHAIV